MEKKESCNSGYFFPFFTDSDTGMIILDREGKIIIANKKMENMLRRICQFEGGRLPEYVHEIPDPLNISIFWASLLPIINGEKENIVFECTYNIPGETDSTDDNIMVNWFNVHAWCIEKIPDKESRGLLSRSGAYQKDWLIGLVLDDYTLVRQEEKKLLLGKEIAEKAMEAKDQFLANMSHEIRTPIQTIIGMLELLQETNLDREQTEYSRQVRFSADVLLSLINDILDYSKIEAGKMDFENIDFDLEQIIEQAVDMIAMEAHKKNLYIATRIPPETNLIIRGDPSKFRQIVINLVKNAVKFTIKGGIIVTLKLSSLMGKEAVHVSVEDTGIGVNEETRPKLFTTFMQADVSNTRRFGGTGLGLAISHNLVNLMKGNIEMVPNKGEGSIFRFSIPLERSRENPEELPPPERNGKLRILIVDDIRKVRNIINLYLQDLGYTDIEEASSGEEALKMMKAASAKGSAFELCFLNMVMPVMDGWRLAAEIYNDSEINRASLILMAPHGLMGAEAKMTLLKWFKAYINKPIKRRNLAETISQVMNEPIELEDVSALEEQINTEGVEHYQRDIPVLLEEDSESLKQHDTVKKNMLPILIAEDHPVNQKLFAMIMEKLGYSAILADDGFDVLEKISANDVSMVLMDIQMPRMNGYEATEKLREQGFTKPIIAVTASALSDERDHCLSAGIDDILVKPFKRTEVENIVEKWKNVQREVLKRPAIPKEKPKAIAPAQKQETVFSAEDILDTFMDNREMVLSLLKRFIERTQNQIKEIPSLIKTGDYSNAMLEAHTIKGAAHTMSGKELAYAAARLELASKNSDIEEIKAAFPNLKDAFIRFRKEAINFIRQLEVK
ncbi:MAG: response regulator [Treponema sp.]|nr:response regulator [Treponema sp.]